MAMQAERRDQLYHRLREVLGDEHALTLMESLPMSSVDLATQGDIAGLNQRIYRLELRMDRFEQRMDGFEERMERFEERMGRFENTMERFDERLHDFHGALREQTRTFILAQTTALFAVAGLAFAAARLV